MTPAAAAASVRLVVFDFDGVFTDNRVYVLQDGSEAVCCNRSDGIGLRLLRRAGVHALVLSTEVNPVVRVRCEKLGIEAIQSCPDKGERLRTLSTERRIDVMDMAYLGNDVNDLDCLHMVGLPACVADAYSEVKATCRFQTRRAGGQGAVREFCEYIIAARSRLQSTMA